MPIDIEPLLSQIDDTENEMLYPLPTPPVGTMIVWYDRGQKIDGSQRAAIVTKVEGPGKLQLTVFAPNAMPTHKIGSLHISHPVHTKAHNSVSKNNGGWDYRDGDDIPDTHYEAHRNVLQTKLTGMRRSLEEAEQIAAKESAVAKGGKRRTGEAKAEVAEA